jgi:hypothetical protein
MDGVKLLNRRDLKYVMHLDEAMNLFDNLKKHYKILTINDKISTHYETLYFDYPDFEFYIRHHNERVNRYKVRYRKYVESELVYFEIKHKDNRGWTSKERCKRKKIHTDISEKSRDLIINNTTIDPDKLEQKLWVNYERITLVSNNMNERLTIDLDLSYKWEDTTVPFNNMVIMEVKVSGNVHSPAIRILKDAHVRQFGISKYCMGIATIYPHLKQNNFKPKLNYISKYKTYALITNTQ